MQSTALIPEAAQRPALLNYVRQRQCVLFVGAGLSRAAGYPDWRGLMEKVVEKTSASFPDHKYWSPEEQYLDRGSAGAELSKLLKLGRYAEVADQCREILGSAAFASILREELAKPVLPPEATHRAIVQTPYASIVTTNFDTLLEDAYALWSNEGVPKCPTSSQLGRHGTLLLDRTFFLLKAHGTIHDAASLVFTSEDYRRIIHANPAFQSMMAAILLSHAVIFVGYSLSDSNFRLLLDSQLSTFGKQAPPRYALMEDIGALEAQILRRTAGIEAISYPRGAHDCVGLFLSTLASATQIKAPRRSVPLKVIRELLPLPALRVAVRVRDAMLDVEWFETTTDDLQGLRVPPRERRMGSTPSPNWLDVIQSLGNRGLAIGRRTGLLLAKPFEQLKVPLILSKPRLVMLDIPNELAALPWEWMQLIHSVEEYSFDVLCMSAPVCRTVPGFDDASRGRPFFHAPLRVLIIADAIAESKGYALALPGRREEAKQIARLFTAASKLHEVKLLVGREAHYQRVLREMTAGYDIVHLTGAAYVGEDGESIVPLHDGHVSASELATLLIQHPPGLLFVNEDLSGFVPPIAYRDFKFGDVTRRFDGSFYGLDYEDFYHRLQQRRPGLERVVARAGVGTFIGCMMPSTDSITREIAVAFYKHLLAGQPIAHALFLARVEREYERDPTPMHFAMAGYPDSRITDPEILPAKTPPRSKTRRGPRAARSQTRI